MTELTRRQLLTSTATAAAAATLASAPLLQAAVQQAAVPQVAGIVTIYRPFSHADVILGKILAGWEQQGGPGPQLKLASLYVDQFVSDDLARDISRRYGIPIFSTIEQALTLGTSSIAVDGVLSIGEHGDYPFSEIGQQLYPRRRFFSEIAAAFEKHGRVVPVFNDKHLGPAWEDGLWMYNEARRLRIPLLAGSSLPVGYRLQPEILPMNCDLEAAVGIGYSGLDVYGIHALEFLQWHVERRRGAESGVRWVQALKGAEIWRAVDDGAVRSDLLAAAFSAVPHVAGSDVRQDADAVLFLYEYRDGFRGAQFMLSCATGTGAAFAVRGQPIAVSVFDERTEPKYPHFAYLLKAIERLVHSGRAPYPVERTLLTGGILDRALTSLHAGGVRRETPELAISYQPVDYPFAQHVSLLKAP